MKMYRCKGTITVFLSIVSILFLSLACTLVESARLQGARAKAAAVSDISLFSVFGEYERGLLKNYDVYFPPGGPGRGGMMDRFDGILFCAAAVWMFFHLFRF